MWLLKFCGSSLLLEWKCVLCPTENVKGNLEWMECYTNSNVAKTVEIIQMPVKSLLYLFNALSQRYFGTGMWLLTVIVFLWHHHQTLASRVCKIPLVWDLAIFKSPQFLWEQMSKQEQYKVAIMRLGRLAVWSWIQMRRKFCGGNNHLSLRCSILQLGFLSFSQWLF